MHIPDGYLSPVFSLGAGVVTVPTWIVGARKVNAVLTRRTVPLLAIFSAFVFTLMMFNVPVPGGTTAHAVGGTLIAIVLGPWAASIGVSIALIIQALFFGDGGVLAIFTNCLNMGIILPFVGYFIYKLLADQAPMLSGRRVWAAAIGSYIGLSVAALAVGIELGLQPILFHDASGHPLYSPYTLSIAISAMLLAHMLGACLVEALVTGLVVAYLQKNHPEYLTSLRGVVTGKEVAEGSFRGRYLEEDVMSSSERRGLVPAPLSPLTSFSLDDRRTHPHERGQVHRRSEGAQIPTHERAEGWAPGIPLWQIIIFSAVGVVVILFLVGLLAGGGNVGHLFGADWSQVDWSAVGSMMLVTLILAVILIPAAWFLLPKRLKKVGALFMALAILAPLGLIAPGFAYAEGSASDIEAAFGYVPQGLQQLSGFFSAPFSEYNLQFPFFNDAHAPLWHAAIGYEISGIIGMLLIGGISFGLGYLFRRREPPTLAIEQAEGPTQ